MAKDKDISSACDLKWTKAKVHVYSDSVFMSGKITEQAEAAEGWKVQLMDFQSTVSIQESCGINGGPVEFEWNFFPGLASLALHRKIHGDLQRRNIDPDNFGNRFIKKIMENVFQIPKKTEIIRRDSRVEIGRSVDLEVKRSGVVHARARPKGSGTPWQ